VEAGERAHAEEYVAPPFSVNVDRTENEVTYTLGEYLEPSVVQEAFKLKDPLPERHGIAPSQPNPHRGGDTWTWTAVWALALLLIYMVVNAMAAKETVLEEEVRLPPDARSGTPTAMHFSQPFEIRKRGNVRAELVSRMNNDWVGIQGSLVNEATGEVFNFYEESEGGQSASEYLSSVTPGRYVLRSTAFFDGRKPGGVSYRVALVSDTPRGNWFCCALVLLLIGPVLAWFRSSSFESARWAESNLGSE
jgi:hypothetical protein